MKKYEGKIFSDSNFAKVEKTHSERFPLEFPCIKNYQTKVIRPQISQSPGRDRRAPAG